MSNPNAPGNYQPETCAWCQGNGKEAAREKCRVCAGQGSRPVLQPSRKCPQCQGTGSKTGQRNNYEQDACSLCRGIGWSHFWRQ